MNCRPNCIRSQLRNDRGAASKVDSACSLGTTASATFRTLRMYGGRRLSLASLSTGEAVGKRGKAIRRFDCHGNAGSRSLAPIPDLRRSRLGQTANPALTEREVTTWRSCF
jgi:hypothetical protein